MSKIRAGATVHINAWAVISRAIEDGAILAVARWQRKGIAPPRGLTDEQAASLQQHIEDAISNALAEAIDCD